MLQITLCPLTLKVSDIFQFDNMLINVGQICNVVMNTYKVSMQHQCHQRS